MTPMTLMKRFIMRFAVLAMAFVLVGCASTGANPKDPLEPFNRAMFKFNDTVDQAALKPAAETYQKVLPSFVQTGIGNFFGNIGDVWTSVNNLLQGKVADGMSDFMRVTFNSTFGLGGLFDIASAAGMPKHKEDFGQTLGKWGVAPGPYVVLPLLGSSTVRDTVALPLDFKGDLWLYKYPVRWRNTGSAIRLIDQRAAVLGASNLLEDAALDRYEFVRDAYMQRRESRIYDGDVPQKSKLDDDNDPGPTLAAPAMPAEPSARAEVVPAATKSDTEPDAASVVKLEKEAEKAVTPPVSQGGER